MAQKESHTNELIQLLINKFSDYCGNIQNRLKVNSLVSELNEKATKDLMNFINMSSIRYKSVKSGNSLESVLTGTKKTYNEIAEKILRDEFYRTQDVFCEQKKLRKKTNTKQNAEIIHLRNRLKEAANGFTKDELRKRAQMERNNAEKKKLPKKGANNILWSERKRRERSFSGSPSKHGETQSNQVQSTSIHSDSLPKENDSQKYYDGKEMNDKIETYQNFLNEVRRTHNEKDPMKISKKFTFVTEDTKLLNYKQQTNVNVVKKKDENNRIDIKKLIKFTKRGKTAHENKINLKMDNDSMDYIIPSGIATTTDFGNTYQLVKNEAGNCMLLDEIFSQKRNKLDEYFKESELPRIEDYEDLNIKKIASQQGNANQMGKTKASDMHYSFGRVRIDPREEFIKIYETKQAKWKKEDIQQEEKQKLEKEKRKETKQFLNQIKKRPRFIQQYIDQYSIRDGKTNKHLIEFDHMIGKHVYEKKKLHQKIEEFVDDLKEKEKHQKEQYKKNEITLPTPTDEIAEIIRKNIEDEEDTGEKSIKFGETKMEERRLISPVKKAAPSYDVEYKKFLEFKKDVIEREKEKNKTFQNRKKNAKEMLLPRSRISQRMSTKSFVSQTPDEIVKTLKHQTESLLKRKGTFTDKELMQVGKENLPLGVKPTLMRRHSTIQQLSEECLIKEKKLEDSASTFSENDEKTK